MQNYLSVFVDVITVITLCVVLSKCNGMCNHMLVLLHNKTIWEFRDNLSAIILQIMSAVGITKSIKIIRQGTNSSI